MSEYNIYPTLHSISPFFSRFIIWYMALSINFFLLNQSPDIYTLVTGSSEWLFKGQPPPPPPHPPWGHKAARMRPPLWSWSPPIRVLISAAPQPMSGLILCSVPPPPDWLLTAHPASSGHYPPSLPPSGDQRPRERGEGGLPPCDWLTVE